MARLDNKHIKYIIAGAALVVLLVIVGAWLYIRSERQQMQSVQSELVDMEKQRMQQELDELAAQYQLQYEKLALHALHLLSLTPYIYPCTYDDEEHHEGSSSDDILDVLVV